MSLVLHTAVLNTGIVRNASRGEVSPPALVVIRPLILANGRTEVPELDGYVVTEPSWGSVHMTIAGPDGMSGVIAVCDEVEASFAAWRKLHEAADDRSMTDPANPPLTPWAGLTLGRRMYRQPPEETTTLIIVTRVAGWAWIERD